MLIQCVGDGTSWQPTSKVALSSDSTLVKSTVTGDTADVVFGSKTSDAQSEYMFGCNADTGYPMQLPVVTEGR